MVTAFAPLAAGSGSAASVPQLVPILTTQATPTATPGQPILDVATVAGATGGPVPAGTVTFRLYRDPACQNLVFTDSPRPLSASGASVAQATSTAFVPQYAFGSFHWRAFYSGDPTYVAVSAPCGEPGETTETRQLTATISPSATTRSVVGRAILHSATVTGAPPPAPGPTGHVHFQLHDDPECTHPIASSGHALEPTGPSTAQANSSPYFPSAPGTYYWWATYNGDGFYSGVHASCGGPGQTTTVLPRDVVADFDADLRTDLSVFRPSTATWFVAKSSGGAITGQFGVPGDIPVPADYDGDHQSDVGVFRPSSGTWFVTMSGGGSIAGQFGVGGDLPVPADYDGDGLADVAVFRPTTGTWFVEKSAGGTIAGNFGTIGDVPVARDYDGDSKADLAVFRPATGTWFVDNSTGGITSQNLGFTGGIPAPGDYDGDGLADIAVFRPTTGTWFVSKSAGGAIIGNIGMNGDLPVPGDYDGDGLADLTVFRPGSATWFLNQTSAGPTAGSFGVAGDVPLPLAPAIRALFPAGAP